MIEQIRVKRTREDAKLPTRAHADDAGLDIYGLEDCLIKPGEGKLLRTGIAISLPRGFFALVADRSSQAKRGLKTAGGVIDSGYRGEIHVVLWNISQAEIEVRAGDKVAQLLILPVTTPAIQEVSELDETDRGSKGFGSSGR